MDSRLSSSIRHIRMAFVTACQPNRWGYGSSQEFELRLMGHSQFPTRLGRRLGISIGVRSLSVRVHETELGVSS